jgi:hypothetical protein
LASRSSSSNDIRLAVSSPSVSRTMARRRTMSSLWISRAYCFSVM